MATAQHQNKTDQPQKNTSLRQPQAQTSLEREPSPPELQAALGNPRATRPETILHLQRLAGNRATHRLIQTKLMVGPAGDRYEQEADQVAQQVMTMTLPAGVASGERGQPVQRQEDEEEIQAKPLASSITHLQRQEDEEEIQTKSSLQRSSEDGFEAGREIEQQLAANRGGGSPLPNETRAFMEPRFGADFSGVRIHTGGEAAQLSRSVQAQAFTHGSDIYFNEGKYNPETEAGKELLAHELTHTIQQTGGTQSAVQRQHIMSYKRWKSVSNLGLFHKRSKPLQAIDQALQEYHQAQEEDKVQKLVELQDLIKKWKEGKERDVSIDGKKEKVMVSERDLAMEELEQEIETELAEKLSSSTEEKPPEQIAEPAKGALLDPTDPLVQKSINAIMQDAPVDTGEEIPSESEIAEARASGTEIGNEVAPAVKDNPAGAELVMKNMEAQAANSPETPVKKSFGEKFKSFGKKALGYGWTVLKLLPTAVNGLLSVAKTGLTKIQGFLDSILTGIPKFLSDIIIPGLIEKLSSARQWTEGAVKTLGSAVFTTISQVATIVGFVFTAMQAGLDFRAAISSAKKSSQLNELANESEMFNSLGNDNLGDYNPGLVAAIRFSASKKYAKSIKRTVAVVGGLLGLAGGITLLALGGAAALASNPVGWAIATAIAGVATVIGVGLTLYTLGRWIYKKAKGILGVERHTMAKRMFDTLVGWGRAILQRGQALAEQAIAALGLNVGRLKGEWVTANKGDVDTQAKNRHTVRKRWIGAIQDKIQSK